MDSDEKLIYLVQKYECLFNPKAKNYSNKHSKNNAWEKVSGEMKLTAYMEYAEKLATVASEISYLSGNTVASDAICERIDHATGTFNNQKLLTHNLEQESLEIQQRAIIGAPNLEDKLKNREEDNLNKKI